ncbi:MAG: hypothetical protein WDN46_12975 [Methylocella sp.]
MRFAGGRKHKRAQYPYADLDFETNIVSMLELHGWLNKCNQSIRTLRARGVDIRQLKIRGSFAHDAAAATRRAFPDLNIICIDG